MNLEEGGVFQNRIFLAAPRPPRPTTSFLSQCHPKSATRPFFAQDQLHFEADRFQLASRPYPRAVLTLDPPRRSRERTSKQLSGGARSTGRTKPSPRRPQPHKRVEVSSAYTFADSHKLPCPCRPAGGFFFFIALPRLYEPLGVYSGGTSYTAFYGDPAPWPDFRSQPPSTADGKKEIDNRSGKTHGSGCRQRNLHEIETRVGGGSLRFIGRPSIPSIHRSVGRRRRAGYARTGGGIARGETEFQAHRRGQRG